MTNVKISILRSPTHDGYVIRRSSPKNLSQHFVSHSIALEIARDAGFMSIEKFVSSKHFVPEKYGFSFPVDPVKKRNLPDWF